jgi:hypothetical protein
VQAHGKPRNLVWKRVNPSSEALLVATLCSTVEKALFVETAERLFLLWLDAVPAPPMIRQFIQWLVLWLPHLRIFFSQSRKPCQRFNPPTQSFLKACPTDPG